LPLGVVYSTRPRRDRASGDFVAGVFGKTVHALFRLVRRTSQLTAL